MATTTGWFMMKLKLRESFLFAPVRLVMAFAAPRDYSTNLEAIV
jgi:hypothetical protein